MRFLRKGCYLFSLTMIITFLIQIDTFAVEKKSRFEQLELFNKVLYLIESQYYREVDTEKLIQGAIKGMMETLDPHSSFLDKEIFAKMQVDTSGEFGGLGIEVTQKDGVIYIISPIDDTPAYKAGLKAGDKIVEINHESTLGLTLEMAVKKMKGAPNSKVNIGVIREDVEGIKYVDIVRQIIQIKPVKTALIEDNFAFIRLTQFQKRSAASIREALKNLKHEAERKGGLKGIILDLRSNPGGLLDEAVEVASVFLKDGKVVSTEGRDPTKKEIHYVSQKGEKELELPMAVLINGASASASEIVAGALQDHNRAIIMGSQSFGKGSVQTVAKIDDDNGVKLTIAQYMTPQNRKIQAIGIKTDIELDEVDAAWVKSSTKRRRFIRESDLRNHLNATVETEIEKQERLKKEKEERIARIKEIEEERTKGDNQKAVVEKEENFRPYEAKTDFQVLQAINFLKTVKILKRQNLH